MTSEIEASQGAEGIGEAPASTAVRSSTPVPKIGVWSWTFVGFVVALAIVVTAFGVVSEILLPLLFAAVLAVIFKPVVVSLIGHRFKPSLAAGMIVLGLLLLMVCVLVGTIRGIADQKDEISASVDAAIAKLAESIGADPATLEDLRQQSEEAAPAFAEGIPAKLLAGVGSIVALAGGIILGALIMYYLLKDGAKLRRAVVAQVEDPGIREDVDGFIGDACRDPPQLRQRAHGHVRDRLRGHRHRGPPDGPAARVHDRGRELRRWLHPLHRGLPRWRSRGDRGARRRRASVRERSCSSSCWRRT